MILTHANDIVDSNINNGFWVITGANIGIGFSLASLLKNDGKKLLLIDKNIENLNHLVSKDVVVKKFNLSEINQINELSELIKTYPVYCLVNNAGVGYKGSLEEISIDKINNTIRTNIIYPVILTKLLTAHLKEFSTIIVNVASSVAFNPLPNMSLYSASKAFLLNWSESLSYELRDTKCNYFFTIWHFFKLSRKCWCENI